jgi:hypothetical protein
MSSAADAVPDMGHARMSTSSALRFLPRRPISTDLPERHDPLRAETERSIADIKQALALLRRHL